MSEPLFLGLDLSTQQLKAILITSNNDIVHESAVHFDRDLPHFKTTNGSIHHDPRNDRGDEVTVPVGLWIEALDELFKRMKEAGARLDNVLAIGGSAQQHGSVYWSREAKAILSNLDARETLAKQLVPKAFSLQDAPIWQDSSTTPECKILNEVAGGEQALADLTGSRAYERFTASQIMKIFKSEPDVYKETGGISLVSSFLATIFLDASTDGPSDRPFPALFEVADASGMNLMNISTHLWEDKLLEACGGSAQDLRAKLGGQNPVEGGTNLGTVGSYAVKRWGFNKDCIVSPITGDNPGTVAALISEPGAALLSLGTSTTFLLSVPPTHDTPTCTTSSHLLAHPTSRQSSIIMLCYKNGGLTREGIRNDHTNRSWDEFDSRVKTTAPGCDGYIGLYFPLKEIIPPNVQGDYYFKIQEDGTPNPVEDTDFPAPLHPRAILESQLLSIKSRIVSLVPPDSPPLTHLLITGGSARNVVFQQVIADVFNMSVYITSEESSKEAAALGGAFLGKWAWWKGQEGNQDRSYEEMIHEKKSGATEHILVATPNPENAKVYGGILDAYRKAEQLVVERSQ